MSLLRLASYLGKACAVASIALAVCPTALADGGLVCHKCPPTYVHCLEGAPCIKFKCGCPKPVCNPCSLEHFGYYQTCWRPWPFAADLSHCTAPGTECTPTMPPGESRPMPGANNNR
jgi:hypothetical protein